MNRYIEFFGLPGSGKSTATDQLLRDRPSLSLVKKAATPWKRIAFVLPEIIRRPGFAWWLIHRSQKSWRESRELFGVLVDIYITYAYLRKPGTIVCQHGFIQILTQCAFIRRQALENDLFLQEYIARIPKRDCHYIYLQVSPETARSRDMARKGAIAWKTFQESEKILDEAAKHISCETVDGEQPQNTVRKSLLAKKYIR